MTAAHRPIIIRRKKVYKADGHHGGAWKVAYADFVTAMMAFFLLMWLLNATTEEQRKGIADYFNPNIPIAAVSGGGADALNGDSIFSQSRLSRDGIGAKTTSTKQGKAEGDFDKKSPDLQENIDALNKVLKEKGKGLLEHVILKHSPEGLMIELIDTNSKPLFEVGNSSPSVLLKELLQVVSDSFGKVTNEIKIVGHTDTRVFPENARYSNWELSSDRANTARRLLLSYGLNSSQIKEVSGKGATDLLSEDGLAPQNRRISIILLQKDM